MIKANREDVVHDAVKRLVRTPAINDVLSFYARTNIHSDLERYVHQEVARYNNQNGIAG